MILLDDISVTITNREIIFEIFQTTCDHDISAPRTYQNGIAR